MKSHLYIYILLCSSIFVHTFIQFNLTKDCIFWTYVLKSVHNKKSAFLDLCLTKNALFYYVNNLYWYFHMYIFISNILLIPFDENVHTNYKTNRFSLTKYFFFQEFDKKYNPTWHCIVGRNFGSYVTHETRHFIYFYLGQVAILLFKSG